jgi:hypothetical protein
MSKRGFTEARPGGERSSSSSLSRAPEALDLAASEPGAALQAVGGWSPDRTAAALHRMTGGHIGRAAHLMTGLQQHAGNRYTRRVVNQSRAIQAKLMVGQSSSPHEREADSVARHITSGRAPGAPPTSFRGAATPMGRDTEGAINRARGRGQPLPPSTRDEMGHALGADLDGVRVHADGGADLLSRGLKARAFTTGQDIFFRRGEYNPGSGPGKELLAHELTHVVQQTTEQTSPGLVQRVELDEATTLQEVHDALGQADSTFNYSTVSNDILVQIAEFNEFKTLRKKPAVTNGEAALACRLALRDMAEGSFDMEENGLDVLSEATSRISHVEATSEHEGHFKWTQGPNKNNSYWHWLFDYFSSKPKDKGGTMNCWEAVLFGAAESGVVPKAKLVEVYKATITNAAEINAQEPTKSKLTAKKEQLERRRDKGLDYNQQDLTDTLAELRRVEALMHSMTWEGALETLLLGGPARRYNPKDATSPRPLKGDIVIFNSIYAHTTLAVGNTSGSPRVLSLWQEPNNADYLQETTVADLLGASGMGSGANVFFYRPGWL